MAVSVTAALHLMLLFLLWQTKPATPQDPEASHTSTVRLIPDRSVSPAAAQPSSRSTPPPPPTMAAVPLPSIQGLHTQIDLLPESADWAVTPAPDASAHADQPKSYGRVGLDGAAPVPAGPASGPQRLATKPSREVLSGALANPAVMDPRSNSPRPSLEEKIALDLNPELCLKEERLPEGTIRRALVKRKEVPSAAQAYTSQRTARVMVCS